MDKTNETIAIIDNMAKEFIQDIYKKTGARLALKIVKSDSVILRIKSMKNISEYPPLTLEEIETIVLDNYPYNITSDHLHSENRSRVYVDARAIFCHIARIYKYSYQEISRYLNRDHSSIIHLVKKTNDLLDVDVVFKDIYYNVLNKIKTNADPV